MGFGNQPTLVWHSHIPSWVTKGGLNNETLISIMKNHIANVIGKYKGKCYAWDVVDEVRTETARTHPPRRFGGRPSVQLSSPTPLQRRRRTRRPSYTVTTTI